MRPTILNSRLVSNYNFKESPRADSRFKISKCDLYDYMGMEDMRLEEIDEPVCKEGQIHRNLWHWYVFNTILCLGNCF